ncbi:fad binding domain-containing protein [Colletotrichum incanum]|uniref:Fad binding domain-containing protein n=1 Tax=Colletotrichum incanum TaxID=1573173 RepID=A0A161W230_COLIC|nr:fad binding domain-containing protein [Colletotrichum incanum]
MNLRLSTTLTGQMGILFPHLEQALKKTCLKEVQESITIPKELRILAEHVKALTGPGFTAHKSRCQTSFWPGIFHGSDVAEEIAKTVKTPEEISLIAVNKGWKCATGWEPGYGYECYFYIVCCRKAVQPGQDASSEARSWKYTSADPMDFGMFGTIPDLLAWYRRYREKAVPEASGLRGEDFLNGDIFQ